MLKIWRSILMCGAIILILSGCAESNTKTTQEEKQIAIANKKEPTAWEGAWTFYSEDVPMSGDAITLEIADNSEGEFSYIIKHAGKFVAEGAAELNGKNSYSDRSDDNCTIIFNEDNLNIDLGSYGTSEECMNIESLSLNGIGTGVFARDETELVNFRQILFLTPEQDQLLLNLVGKEVYAEFVNKFKEFEQMQSYENLASAFINTTTTSESDENLLIMFNKYDLFWVAYENQGTLNYYTNDKWSAENLPEIIVSAFPTATDIQYMNKDNAEKFVANTFADFPLLNKFQETNTSELISTENNGSYTLRPYYNLGVDSYYQHGDYTVFLNKHYDELGITLTLEEGNTANVFFVRDKYNFLGTDEEQNFSGEVVASILVNSSDPTYSFELGISDIEELYIVIASEYKDNVAVTINEIELVSYMDE